MTDPDALDRFDDFLDDGGTVALFVALLLPTFPDDVLCFLAGLSELPLGRFLLLVVLGGSPRSCSWPTPGRASPRPE